MTDPLFLIFNLLAAVYVFQALRLIVTIVRERSSIFTDSLLGRQRALANQASFFAAVPPGVLIHELGHVAAIWFFGGQVVEFGYRVFWGYVIPRGQFTLSQSFSIALAGTAGSLLYAGLLHLLLRRSRFPVLRYFGLRAVRYQIIFSLIFYPLFTLMSLVGDWRTMYDFSSTPVSSSALLIAHVGALILYFYSDRMGYFEMPDVASAADQESLLLTLRRVVEKPVKIRQHMELIDTLRARSAPGQCRRALRTMRNDYPDDPHTWLYRATLAHKPGEYSAAEARCYQAALDKGLPLATDRAVAHIFLGGHSTTRERFRDSIDHFNKAGDLLRAHDVSAPTDRLREQIHLMRSDAYRHSGDYYAARLDLLEAIRYSDANGRSDHSEQYRQRLAVLEQHAGSILD